MKQIPPLSLSPSSQKGGPPLWSEPGIACLHPVPQPASPPATHRVGEGELTPEANQGFRTPPAVTPLKSPPPLPEPPSVQNASVKHVVINDDPNPRGPAGEGEPQHPANQTVAATQQNDAEQARQFWEDRLQEVLRSATSDSRPSGPDRARV